MVLFQAAYEEDTVTVDLIATSPPKETTQNVSIHCFNFHQWNQPQHLVRILSLFTIILVSLDYFGMFCLTLQRF